jgi:predicted DNA-binding protein (UPF0251 family)
MLAGIWRRNNMSKFHWERLDIKEAIRLRDKEFFTIGELADRFRCSRDHIERMLKSEGQL